MKTNVRKKRHQNRFLPWFGSDCSVAEQYAGLLKDCSWIGIPFCGGLSIVAHLVETAGEIVCNDRHRLAINLYQIVSNPLTREDLVNDLEATPFHESILRESQEFCKKIGHDRWIEMTPREAAFHYFVTCWMGRSGKAGTLSEFNGGLAMRWDAGGGSSPLRFQTAVRSLQEVWGPICERCSFLCMDYTDLLAKVKDDPKCAVFADPPWVGAGDDYRHSFTRADHLELFHRLDSFSKTKIVIRYGDDPLIRDLYRGVLWHIREITSRDQANGGVKELCITNFEVA